MSGIIPGAGRGSTVESAVRTTFLNVPAGSTVDDAQLSVLEISPISLYSVSLFLIVTNNGTLDTDSLNFGIGASPFSNSVPADAYNAYFASELNQTTNSTAKVFQDYSGLGVLSGPSMEVYGGGLTSILTGNFMYYTGSLSASGFITVSYTPINGGGSDATLCTVLPGSYMTLTRLS